MKFYFNININNQSCICSRFDRFNVFFPLWLQNAINYKIDIVIFLDKFNLNDELINYVKKFQKTYKDNLITIINVSDSGNINEINNVHFFSGLFQRLYELGYKNIVYTDPDELLITEDLNWYFSQKIDHGFSQGFEIVHNVQKNEKHYDGSLKLLDQRNYGVWSNVGLEKKDSSYSKLVIFKKGFLPKTRGRHATEYTSFKNSWDKLNRPFELYTLHLREMDVKTMVENYKKSMELYSFCRESMTFENEESAKTRINRWFTPNLVDIPTDIKNIITKHNL